MGFAMLKTTESPGSSRGFSLVELLVAIVLLTVALLGIAASAGRLSGAAAKAEATAQAIQALEDRINYVRLDPVYDSLSARYTATETTVLGLPGVTRQTSVTRVQTVQPVTNKVLDYTTITVTVSGGPLEGALAREIVVGAP